MATIGRFTKCDAGFSGSVKTLTLNVKAKFVPADKDSEKAPDFRILAGEIEVGAAWKKNAAQNGRNYLSVRIDDPSFAAPIFANLIEVDGNHSLIWSRRAAD